MKLWYTSNSPFTSYTTVTPHSDSRSDISAYVTSHVQYTMYKIIACIEHATAPKINNPYRDWKRNHVSASAPYVLAASIRATLCDCDRCGTVEANGVSSSSEAEISNYFWIFWNCHRLSKFYLVLKYSYKLYA